MSDRQEALTRTLDLLTELLPTVPRDSIDSILANTPVRLVVGALDLADRRTQAAVYVLVSLLVRTGINVQAEMASVRRLVDLPGLTGGDFGASMRDAVPRMFPNAQLATTTARADIALVVGAAAVEGAASVVRLSAEGSRAWVTRGEKAMGRWDPSDGLVALAAAGLAATEALKDVLRPMAPRVEVLDPLQPSFVVPVSLSDQVDLGRLFLISAGAISQHFVLSLAADKMVTADLVVLDGDVSALSNANRCPFVMIDDVGEPKVERIAAQLPSRLRLDPIAHHLDDETEALVPAGATILVGADDIAVRHRAQRLSPSWLGIGATSHFFVFVTEHEVGEPCAGCAHAQLGQDIAVIPTLAMISFWAGLLLALRLVARAAGHRYPPTQSVTNFWALRPEAMIEHELTFNPMCPVRAHQPASVQERSERQ